MTSRRAVVAVALALAIVVVGFVQLAGSDAPDEDQDAPSTAERATAPSRTEVRPDPADEVEPVDASTFFVSPSGSDDGRGTSGDPFGTIQHAMEQLGPGDTLIVRGGTYREQIELTREHIARGTQEAPIVVQAHPRERPVIEGLLWLEGADHWTVRGINVTWSSDNDSDEHMVKFLGGTGWRYTEAEVWDARSFAAILVSDGAQDFRLDRLYVHDTHETNDENQDHLIYVASGNEGGVIERNVLARSPNGRGVKVGPGSLDEPGSDGLVIRYNTFYDNTGPSNVRFSGESSDNEVYGNIFVGSGDGEAAVTSYQLEGERNVVRDNIAWDAAGVVDTTDGLADGRGNVMLDPELEDPDDGEFRPLAARAGAYGAHATGR